jgi:hypothetical protein
VLIDRNVPQFKRHSGTWVVVPFTGQDTCCNLTASA